MFGDIVDVAEGGDEDIGVDLVGGDNDEVFTGFEGMEECVDLVLHLRCTLDIVGTVRQAGARIHQAKRVEETAGRMQQLWMLSIALSSDRLWV